MALIKLPEINDLSQLIALRLDGSCVSMHAASSCSCTGDIVQPFS